MNELEASMSQLLELAKANPDLLFKIAVDETRMKWSVEFTKGGYWWCAVPDDDETLADAIKESMTYFESLTDQAMMDNIQKEWQEAEEIIE